MPSLSKSGHRRGLKENGKGRKLGNTAALFHGGTQLIRAEIRRQKTNPNLLSAGKLLKISLEMPPKLTKLLLNVTMQSSLGVVQVVMSPESTVGDLIAVAVKLYGKEERRPFLLTMDPTGFDLHHSQFSFENKKLEISLSASL